MVLEVGAGSGLATRELVLSGSQVVAVEPGLDLAALLEQEVPGASLMRAGPRTLLYPTPHSSQRSQPPRYRVDLSIDLPCLQATLRPSGAASAGHRHARGNALTCR
jgi:hypothetical protein